MSAVPIPIETGDVLDQVPGTLAVGLDTPQRLGLFPFDEEGDLLTVG
jgi:hypothetical protein